MPPNPLTTYGTTNKSHHAQKSSTSCTPYNNYPASPTPNPPEKQTSQPSSAPHSHHRPATPVLPRLKDVGKGSNQNAQGTHHRDAPTEPIHLSNLSRCGHENAVVPKELSFFFFSKHGQAGFPTCRKCVWLRATEVSGGGKTCGGCVFCVLNGFSGGAGGRKVPRFDVKGAGPPLRFEVDRVSIL